MDNVTDCTDLTILTDDEIGICLDAQDAHLQLAIDTVWVLVTAIGILSLQVGFAMLETGTVQAKNTKSVLMKNAVDTIFGTVIWWAVGYGVYTGDGEWISGEPYLFFITEAQSGEYPAFVQQYGFAATAVTIVSGCVLSRMRFESYIIYSIVFVGFIYAAIAHIGWADNGWLYKQGYLDFAGSGLVHELGGFAGIVGSIFVGPRAGRFYAVDEEVPGAVRQILPHSTVLITLGGFMLYVGWFSFNAGSSGGMGPSEIGDANLAMINTLMGSAAGGAAATVYSIFLKHQHDVPLIVNGLLCGLVAITGPSAYVDTWAALLIGSSAAMLYIPCAYAVLHKLKIDDPVNAFCVHGISGAWGVILTGFFALPQYGGLVYTGSADLLVAQLIGAGVIAGFGLATSFVIFLILRFTLGVRLDYDDQVIGLDDTFHSGNAYPEFDYVTVREHEATKRRLSVTQKSASRLSVEMKRYGGVRSGSEVISASNIHAV